MIDDAPVSVSFLSRREARPSTLRTEHVVFRYSRNLSRLYSSIIYSIYSTALVKDGEINGTVDQDELICDVDLTCQAQVPASNKTISNHLRGRGGHRKALNARVVSASLGDSVRGLKLPIGHWFWYVVIMIVEATATRRDSGTT